MLQWLQTERLRLFLIGVERVEEYVFWAVTGAVGLLISALTFFVKRGMDKKDTRDKEQDKRITEVEDKLNNTINQMLPLYAARGLHSFKRTADAEAGSDHHAAYEKGGKVRWGWIRWRLPDASARGAVLTLLFGNPRAAVMQRTLEYALMQDDPQAANEIGSHIYYLADKGYVKVYLGDEVLSPCRTLRGRRSSA